MEDKLMLMLIDVWVDGYDSVEAFREGCVAFVDDSLNNTATSVKILWYDELASE